MPIWSTVMSAQAPPAAESSGESPKVKLFCKEQQIDPKADPMAWWAAHAPTYPLLTQIACRVLAIPASSAPSEHLFSKLARVNAKDRARMHPQLANALLMF